jgi:flagellar protein FliO/FliZ
MFDYIVRLFILVPLLSGLAWGSLWLWKRLQSGLPAPRGGDVPIRVTASVSLGTAGKLAVVEFEGRPLLIAVSRSGISLIANHRDAQLEGDFHA